MNNAFDTDTKVITGRVRLAYVHLLTPFANDAQRDPKYSVTVLVPKSDAETYQRLCAARDAARIVGRDRSWGGKIPAVLADTIRDADDPSIEYPVDLGKNPDFAGHWVINMSAIESRKPGLTDAELSRTPDPALFYSGMHARITCRAYPYTVSGKRGTSFGLNAVQALPGGAPMGGADVPAWDQFSEFRDDSGASLL